MKQRMASGSSRLTQKISGSGYLLLLIAGGLWGTVGLFVKFMEQSGSTPVMTSFLRVFFSFLIMLAACVFRYGWRSLLVDRRTLAICGLLGLVCHGFYNILYSLSITTAGVSVSAVLLYIAPACTLMFSFLLFKEALTRRKVLAVCINILGCILTVTNGHLTAAAFPVIGILFGLGAGLCYSMIAIIGRFATQRTNPLVMSTYSYLAASLLLLLWMRPWTGASVINGRILTVGFLYALVPTAVAYAIYYWGLGKIKEAGRAPVLTSVETVSAAVIGICVYHEQIGSGSLLGMLLVFCSILIINLQIRRTGQLPIRPLRHIRLPRRPLPSPVGQEPPCSAPSPDAPRC